ncbi:hypothetical protein BS78_05G136000 [Paspalum vaginatum]|nr:hypothetical protein BS78_05G136000 [Paspalum vaginatum]
MPLLYNVHLFFLNHNSRVCFHAHSVQYLSLYGQFILRLRFPCSSKVGCSNKYVSCFSSIHFHLFTFICDCSQLFMQPLAVYSGKRNIGECCYKDSIIQIKHTLLTLQG